MTLELGIAALHERFDALGVVVALLGFGHNPVDPLLLGVGPFRTLSVYAANLF